jgi:hypothetical protein
MLSAVRRWRAGHAEAVLILDQFEELFTQNTRDTQQRFADLLGRLAWDAGVRVVLSMRDDFLIRCHEQPALAPLFEQLTPLLAVSGEGLRRALVEPAKRRGFRFEDDALVNEMVETVEGERGALPLLAFAVSRLWEKRDRERKLLTREAYEAIGGVAGALAQHAEATLERIGTDRQNVVREIFRNLTTAQQTRCTLDTEELLSVFLEAERGAAREVLSQLVDARLLTSFEVEGKEGQPSRHRVEIVHESLLTRWPRLVRWQTQDADAALLRDQLRQAAHLWGEKGKPEDLLLDRHFVSGVPALAWALPRRPFRDGGVLRLGHDGARAAPAEPPADRLCGRSGRRRDRGLRARHAVAEKRTRDQPRRGRNEPRGGGAAPIPRPA